MGPLEIATIVIASLFVVGYLGIEIYRKMKGKPPVNEECGYKHNPKALLKAYRKQKAKEEKKAPKEGRKNKNP